MDAKAALRRDLQAGRDALLWKLEGLSEYDVRRPMTPTGTNLLGLVKHLAFVEGGYFGAVFGRPVPEAQAWIDDDGSEPNWDLWATADESRGSVEEGYRRAWARADTTIESEIALTRSVSVPRSRGADVESTVTASARKPSCATRTVTLPSLSG